MLKGGRSVLSDGSAEKYSKKSLASRKEGYLRKKEGK